MKLPSFSAMQDPWVETQSGFESSATRQRPGQTLIFELSFRNGSLSADVTPLKALGRGRFSGKLKREAGLIFRFAGPERCYLAGIGGWGCKFAITKLTPAGPVALARTGDSDALDLGRTYSLKVELSGKKIRLKNNDVLVLEAEDPDYASGRVGLTTYKTQARFEAIKLEPKPQCFVVMPFAPEFNVVFTAIEEAVEACGIDCIRADELSVSRPIMEDVRVLIESADLIIVDLSGRNPNVYYEAGMAAAWKKPWIVVAQSKDDVTFDVRHVRYILYSRDKMGRAQLQHDLKKAVGDTLPGSATSGRNSLN